MKLQRCLHAIDSGLHPEITTINHSQTSLQLDLVPSSVGSVMLPGNFESWQVLAESACLLGLAEARWPQQIGLEAA